MSEPCSCAESSAWCFQRRHCRRKTAPPANDARAIVDIFQGITPDLALLKEFFSMRNKAYSTATTFLSFTFGALLLSACSTPIKQPEQAAAPAPVAAQPDQRTVATVEAPAVDPLDDPKGVLAKRSVYFDYDSYLVKDEFKSVVDAHSRYLVANKARKIVIQGNTDERGGSEYNLALGQKRADAVRKSLAVLGVPEAQMEAVSFGKEKPKATGSDETAWAENRRADIVYAPK
jgi:peptidoglycan-associated lipoprotein